MAKPAPISPWWAPSRHADRRPALLIRGAIKAAFRREFERAGFTEVECGALARSPGNEAHLSAFATRAVAPDGSARTLYLHTSPEFAAKKLLAAGETRIFDFARVFRNRESGPLHAPEFTMLEWYRTGESWEKVMGDCIGLVRLAAGVAHCVQFGFHGGVCDPFDEAETLSLVEAFDRFAGIDLAASLTDDGEGVRDVLAQSAVAAGVDVAADDTWSDIFSKVLVAKVERQLGMGRPTLLTRYPACEAALARRCDDDPRFAERFELYVCGVELANGFGELTDPDEQRRRFEIEMDEKERVYGERYPIDGEFLDALAEMPAASGVALGFDRLVMLAVGARCLNDVIWTPAP